SALMRQASSVTGESLTALPSRGERVRNAWRGVPSARHSVGNFKYSALRPSGPPKRISPLRPDRSRSLDTKAMLLGELTMRFRAGGALGADFGCAQPPEISDRLTNTSARQEIMIFSRAGARVKSRPRSPCVPRVGWSGERSVGRWFARRRGTALRAGVGVARGARNVAFRSALPSALGA